VVLLKLGKTFLILSDAFSSLTFTGFRRHFVLGTLNLTETNVQLCSFGRFPKRPYILIATRLILDVHY